MIIMNNDGGDGPGAARGRAGGGGAFYAVRGVYMMANRAARYG